MDTGTARRVPDSLGGKLSGHNRLGHYGPRVKRSRGGSQLCSAPAMPERAVSRERRGPGRTPRRCVRALALALLGLATLLVAGIHADVLRVGTSGDYPPFSLAVRGDSQRFEGFDAELARRYAADRGLEIEWVRFRWPTLLRDLEAGRFEVAMSGVTVRLERSVAGTFSVPVVETGAVALVRDKQRFETAEALDREGVRIAVNAGGHLETVARQRFPRATVVVGTENSAVLRALEAKAVDAAITDTAEASVWQKVLPEVVLLGPFTRDRKAFLVAAAAGPRAADLDAWLLAREADGSLDALRREHLGPGPWARVADPLPALAAALDERLSLMPWVGAVKRRTGVPLEVPEREAAVLEAATAAVLEAAHAQDVVAPPVVLVRGFFRAQLDAAKQLQWDALHDPELSLPEALPDLDGALRPALTRIAARSARLLLALPPVLHRDRVAQVLQDGLRSPWLEPSSRYGLVDALVALVGDSQRESAAAPPP